MSVKKIFIPVIVVALLGASFFGGYFMGKGSMYQGKTVQAWAETANTLSTGKTKSDTKIKELNNQIAQLKAAPTPTPEVVYKTNTVTQTQYVPVRVNVPANPTHCTTSYIGEFADTNCY